MGQKINPHIFRIGITKEATSRWFSDRQYAHLLRADVELRKFLKTRLKDGGIANIEIERSGRNVVNIILHAAKPGVIIGRGGSGIEDLKKEVEKRFFRKGEEKKQTVTVNVQEVSRPALSAELVLQGIIHDLEQRVPFRRAMKQALGRVERGGAKGVRIRLAGRLNGAEIARAEVLSKGKIPLHTLRADIDYSRGAARTIYGAIGVKVWVYHGEVFEKET